VTDHHALPGVALGSPDHQSPPAVIKALKDHKLLQASERAEAGSAWREHDLVFASQVGTPLDPSHVRRAFKQITKSAGLGEDWTPRELRHTFVSILSDDGMLIRDIADLVGHSDSRTTETVYRHQLKPVITKGATALDPILKNARTEARKRPATS
jgi:integrase